MKIIRLIWFSFPRDEAARFRAILDDLNCSHCWRDPPLPRARPAFEGAFEDGDSRVEAVRALIGQERLSAIERAEAKYSNAELEAAPLLCLTANRKPILLDNVLRDGGYDLSRACPLCGSGADLRGPLRLPAKLARMRGHLVETTSDHKLVSGSLAELLGRQRFAGLELMEAVAKDGAGLGWRHVIAHNEMPRMDRATRGVITSETQLPCTKCGRDGRFIDANIPTEIVYHRSSIRGPELPEVAVTWECFSKGRLNFDEPRRSYIASPLTLVSPRVMKVFHELHVREARFTPVTIVG